MIIFLRYRFEDTRVINRALHPTRAVESRGGEVKKEEKGKRERERKKESKKGRILGEKPRCRKVFTSCETRDPQIAIHSGLFEIRRNFCLEWFSFSSVASEFNQVESFRFPSRAIRVPFPFPLSTSFVPFDTFNRIASIIVITVVLLLRISRKNVTGSVNRYSLVNKGR